MYYDEDHRRAFQFLLNIDRENLPPFSGNPVPIPLYQNPASPPPTTTTFWKDLKCQTNQSEREKSENLTVRLLKTGT